MKTNLILFLLLFLTSCGKLNRSWQGITGRPSEICHEGVAYLQFESGVSVAYNKNGSIKLCED